MTSRNLMRYLFLAPLLWFLVLTVVVPQAQAASDTPAVAPRATVPAKKVRKPKPAAGVAPKATVATPPPVAPVATTRYEEIELVPVPPPTPTPATEVFD